MDCERFDKILLDLVYGELDELSAAAARRHLEHCARCKNLEAGIRNTRERSILQLEEPPDGFEARVLEAERLVHAHLPIRQRLGRAVSIMAGYAMRPQLAMAALLLLMIGSSLLFLRAKPGQHDAIVVTERGVPESESEVVAIVPLAAPGASPTEPAAAPMLGSRRSNTQDREADDAIAERSARAATHAEEAKDQARADAGNAFGRAMAAFEAKRYAEARQAFDDVARAGGPSAPRAALLAARATRDGEGCEVALPAFDAVRARYGDNAVGNESLWHAANCRRSLGQTRQAREAYEQLVAVSDYARRAEGALDALTLAEAPVAAAPPADHAAVASRRAGASAVEAAKPAAPARARAKSSAKAAPAAASPAAQTSP